MDEEMMEMEQTALPETQEDAPVRKRRGGRKPYTPEQQEAARKAREERKQLSENLHPEVHVQYQDADRSVDELVAAAKEAFHTEWLKERKRRTRITSLKLYIKPEERMAYYVINEKAEGKIPY